MWNGFHFHCYEISWIPFTFWQNVPEIHFPNPFHSESNWAIEERWKWRLFSLLNMPRLPIWCSFHPDRDQHATTRGKSKSLRRKHRNEVISPLPFQVEEYQIFNANFFSMLTFGEDTLWIWFEIPSKIDVNTDNFFSFPFPSFFLFFFFSYFSSRFSNSYETTKGAM